MERPIFASRGDAGKQLAEVLSRGGIESPVIAPILRGGLEVALPIIERFSAPVFPLLVGKVGHPWQPELGLGAIAPDGVLTIDDVMRQRFLVTESALQPVVEAQRKEIVRRKAMYQLKDENLAEGRLVIAVDDGLATGLTAKAAGEYLRRCGATTVILAIPVASDQALTVAEKQFDRVVCLAHSAEFTAVSRWFQSFGQLGDRRIIDLLARTEKPANGSG